MSRLRLVGILSVVVQLASAIPAAQSELRQLLFGATLVPESPATPTDPPHTFCCDPSSSEEDCLASARAAFDGSAGRRLAPPPEADEAGRVAGPEGKSDRGQNPSSPASLLCCDTAVLGKDECIDSLRRGFGSNAGPASAAQTGHCATTQHEGIELVLSTGEDGTLRRGYRFVPMAAEDDYQVRTLAQIEGGLTSLPPSAYNAPPRSVTLFGDLTDASKAAAYTRNSSDATRKTEYSIQQPRVWNRVQELAVKLAGSTYVEYYRQYGGSGRDSFETGFSELGNVRFRHTMPSAPSIEASHLDVTLRPVINGVTQVVPFPIPVYCSAMAAQKSLTDPKYGGDGNGERAVAVGAANAGVSYMLSSLGSYGLTAVANALPSDTRSKLLMQEYAGHNIDRRLEVQDLAQRNGFVGNLVTVDLTAAYKEVAPGWQPFENVLHPNAFKNPLRFAVPTGFTSSQKPPGKYDENQNLNTTQPNFAAALFLGKVFSPFFKHRAFKYIVERAEDRTFHTAIPPYLESLFAAGSLSELHPPEGGWDVEIDWSLAYNLCVFDTLTNLAHFDTSWDYVDQLGAELHHQMRYESASARLNAIKTSHVDIDAEEVTHKWMSPQFYRVLRRQLEMSDSAFESQTSLAAGEKTMYGYYRAVFNRAGSPLPHGDVHSHEAYARMAHHNGMFYLVKGAMNEGVVDSIQKHAPSVNGVVISTHGGRNALAQAAPIEVVPRMRLKAIGAGYEPDQFIIAVDSGFRTSEDVLKGLLLGANLVGLGRFTIYPVLLNGAAGLLLALDDLLTSLIATPVQFGETSLQALAGICLKHDDGLAYKSLAEWMGNPSNTWCDVVFEYLKVGRS